MLENIAGDAEFAVILLMVALFALPIAGIWKTFEKAGENKYAALVPVYNVYIMTRIANVSPWWTLVSVFPYLNVIAFVRLAVGVSKAFGKGTFFGLGVGIVPWLGWPVLGFSDYEYQPN